MAEGRVDEARAHYERAVASGPANAEARNNLGAVLLAYGEPAGSIAQLQEAMRLRPAYAEAHFNLARAYASAGRFAEAVGEATIAEAQAAAAGKSALARADREQLRLHARSQALRAAFVIIADVWPAFPLLAEAELSGWRACDRERHVLRTDD